MYRQPYGQSFRYLCGLYQQSHGARCKHHHVNGLMATIFLLGCVRQRVLSPSLRAELEKRLRALAERERIQACPDTILASKRAALAELQKNKDRAGKNLLLAENEAQYRIVAKGFEQLTEQVKALEAEVKGLEQLAGVRRDLDGEVEAALAVLDRLANLAEQAEDLTALGQLFQQINARLFLRFAEMQQKKRVVNQVAGGVVTFGATAPPVPLYEGPTNRRYVKSQASLLGDSEPRFHETPGIPGCVVPGAEGESLGNVSRGERI
jgi:hypothetical protein